MKNNSAKTLLNPNHISGFTQADGCFHVAIDKNSSSKLKCRRVTPKLILTQHEPRRGKDPLKILEAIRDYFGCGYIIYNKKRKEYNYIINSLSKIKEKVIPHFERYPLKSAKLASYKKLKKIVTMMEAKEHLTVKGLSEIIEIAYSQNRSLGARGTSRNIKKKEELLVLIGHTADLPMKKIADKNDIKLVFDSLEANLEVLDPYFLSGLVDGDGSFNISFRGNKRITPVFTIVQDIESIDLLNSVQKTLRTGSIREVKEGVVRYEEIKLITIIEKVIPHFQEYKLYTNKQEHFEIFSKVCNMLKENQHKTKEGLKTIIDLAYDMNKKGKYRRLTKEEFLKLVGVGGIV